MKLFLWNNLSRDKRDQRGSVQQANDSPCVYLIWYAWATGQHTINTRHRKRKARRVGVWFWGITLEPKLDFGTKTFANKLNRISKVFPHTHKFKENVYFASFKLDFFWVYLHTFCIRYKFPEFLLIFQQNFCTFYCAQGWVSEHKVLGQFAQFS